VLIFVYKRKKPLPLQETTSDYLNIEIFRPNYKCVVLVTLNENKLIT